jgi:hypothetical protein
MKITRVGVDLAKKVFQVHGVGRDVRSAWRPVVALIIGHVS